jgi:hypothetical protein
LKRKQSNQEIEMRKVLPVLCAGLLFAGTAHSADDCQSGMRYIVKPDTYGAPNGDDFAHLRQVVADKNQTAIDALLKSGAAVHVTAGAVACVKDPDSDVAFNDYRKRIVYDSGKVPVWVADDALNPVK